MAKEEENKDLDYDDLDDFDLDIPEIDIDPENDDRSPVRKLSTGFLQGVKDDLTDKRDAPRKLKAILPPSYSSSIDLADETLGTVGNLYNTLRDETREGVKGVKRVARQAIGKHEDKLPSWIAERLKKVVGEEEKSRQDPSVEEQRDDQIQNTLANIFELQVERDEEKDHEENSERAVRDAIEGRRHDSQVEQLFAIRQSVHRQVSYQDQVTARFQRKSLEMQYRQYFLTRDLYKVSEASAKDIKEALQAIVKNTGLPEYRKIELGEAIGQQFRDNMTSGIQSKVSELGSGFFQRASGSLTKRFREKAQGWNEQLKSMTGMAEMAQDASEMVDPYEMAGSSAGGAASGFIGNRFLFPLLRRMGVQNETIANAGRDAQDRVSRLPRQINEWVKENQGAPGVAGFIADAIGGKGLENTLDTPGIEGSLDPAIFDKQTRQSIVEIIPGYLSRIHHELRGFREGMGIDAPDPDGRMTYNLKERGFSSVEREREVLRDMIFNPEDLTSAFDRINDIIDGLDIDRFIGDDKVEDSRRVLSRHLMKEGMDGKDLKLERLSDSSSFGEDVPPEISAAIADAVQQRYNTRMEKDEFGHESFKYDDTRENKDRLSNTRNLFANMDNDVKDPRGVIQALLQVGGEDQLRSLGLLKYGVSGNPEIDYDQVFRVVEQGGYDDLGGEAQRDRREGRRYERYFENVEKLEEAKRDREKEQERATKKEQTWLGGKTKSIKDRFSNAARKAEEGAGLRDNARERVVERATAENRKLTPEQRQTFYGGTVSNYTTLYPTETPSTRELLQTPVKEGSSYDELSKLKRAVRSEKGREYIKDATVEKASDVFRKSKDVENWKKASKTIQEKGGEGISRARAQGSQVAKQLKESKVAQQVAGDERVQKVMGGGRDVYRLSESNLIIREALKLFDRNKELTKQAREALQNHLKLELQTGGEIRVDTLAMPETYLDDVPEKIRHELSEHFNNLIEKEIVVDDTLPTNLKEMVEHTRERLSNSNTVKSTRDFISEKTGAESTLREKTDTFRDTVNERVKEVYDREQTLGENLNRGVERVLNRGADRVKEVGKTVYNREERFDENIQRHRNRFSKTLEAVYDSNLSIEENAQRLADKTGITRKRATKMVERFVKALPSRTETRDLSKATFRPSTESFQTVKQTLHRDEKVSDLHRLAKELYDTETTVSENAQRLVEKTGISKNKATKLFEQLSQRFTRHEDAVDQAKTTSAQESHQSSRVNTKNDLTEVNDREVRDFSLKDRITQGREYLTERLGGQHKEPGVNAPLVTGESWQDAVQPQITGEAYDTDTGDVSRWVPGETVTNLKNEMIERVNRDEIKRAVTSNTLGEFIAKVSASGRDAWTNVDKQQEVSEPVGKGTLEKFSKQLGRFTSAFRKHDGVQDPEEVQRGLTDHAGAVDRARHDSTSVNNVVDRIDHRSVYTDHIPHSDAVTREVRGEEAQELTHPQATTLSDLLFDVKSILRGDEVGVGKDVRTLTERLGTEKDADPDRAQVAVLSRILENVEAIGQHLTKDDEESWFNIVDIGKKTGRVMAKTAGALGNFYLGGLKMFGGGMSGMGSILRGGGRSVGRLLGNMVGLGGKDGIGAVDIYVKGQPQPVLTARGMEDGAYFDANTGETISTVEDLYSLKGDVVDADGNLCATAAELAKGIFDRFGQRINAPGLMSRLASAVSNAAGGLWGYMTFPTRMLLKGPQKLFGLAKGIINRVRDVYVKGEQHPRLLASIMKNGGYISATTGRPIYSLDQIDGEVRDRQGNVILSHEDMRLGLVDWKGEPIGFLDRQLKRVLGAVKLPFKAAGWAFGKAKGAVSWAADKVGSAVGGITDRLSKGIHIGGGSNERLAEMSSEQLEVLRDIRKAIGDQSSRGDDRHDTLKEVRDLLRKKLEGKQPHEWDGDGDGKRDGGWRDIFAQREAEKDEEGGVEKVRDEKDGSLLDTLMKFAAPLISMVGSGISMIMDKVTGLFGGLGDMLAAKMGMDLAGDMMDGPDRRNRTNRPGGGKRGFFRRAAGWMAEKGKSVGGKVLGWGRTALAVGGKHLLRAGAWAGGKALAATAVGGKLLSGAAVAAGGVLSAPVLLTGAAVAAVGVGAYLAWRHYSKDSLGDLGKHRMLQYGVDPENEERVGKLLMLEDELSGNVSFNESSGTLDINQDGVDFEAIYDAFELDRDDPDRVQSFVEWLNYRFLPVYQAARKAVEANADGESLEDVDDLPIHHKKPYFDEATSVVPASPEAPHPYASMASPFGGELTIGPARVEADAERIKEKLREEHDRFQHVRDNAHRGSELPPNHPMQQARRADERSRGEGRLTTPTRTTSRDQNIQMALDRASQTRLRHYTRQETVGQGDVIRITGTLSNLALRSEAIDKITAIDAILLKTMGLKELEPKKVEVLLALIDDVVKETVYENRGLAVWEGSVDDMLDRYRSDFGVSWYQWGDKGRWKTWFRQRFMKVLLSYLTEIKGVSSRPDKAMELIQSSYSDQLAAAEKLSALEVDTAADDAVPIWELTTSPWSGYTLNNDVTSLYPLIAYLRRMSSESRDERQNEVDVRGVSERELAQSSDTSRSQQRENRREQSGVEERSNRTTQSRQQSTHRQEPSTTSGRGPLSSGTERSGGGSSSNAGVGEVPEIPGGSHTPQKISKNEGYETVVTGLIEADIRDPEEQATVLAQLGHESANFTATEENLNYSADALRRVFSKYFPTRQEQQAYARKPEAIANKTYGGRMGNRDPGDGWKYRGRGFIQLTGRDNYERASQALGYDYVNNPDLVSEPEHAIRTSLWWWKDRNGLRPAAQQGDVETSTRLINGGTNGLQDRRNRYRDAIVLARSGELTRDAMEYLGEQQDDSGVMDQVNEQRNVQDLTTPEEEAEITVAQSGSRRATPVDENDTADVQQTTQRTNVSSGGGVTQPGTSSDPEEQRPTVRQAVVSSASIDSSAGINEALNRDPDVAQQQRARQARVVEVQDSEDRQRQVVQSDALLAVKQVLQDSLSTQQSMDGRLKTVVDLLTEGNLTRERGSEGVSPSTDTSQAARTEQERDRRSSSLNFDPRDVIEPAVRVTRRRSI